MVRDEEDGGLLAGVFKRLQQLPHLVVEIGDIGEIGLPGAGNMVVGDAEIVSVIGFKNALRMGVLLIIGNGPDFGHQLGAALVEVPVFLARHIGVMRMGEADRQAPGPRVVAA